MEDDTFGVFIRKVQHLLQVPSNGFPLSVFIACEPNVVGVFRCFSERINDFDFARFDGVVGCIIVSKVDTYAVIFDPRDVSDMPLRRQDVIVLAQKLFYRFCLCRRLYYDQIFTHTF